MAANPAPELLLQHAAHVRALARRLVFDAELAAEVEQETWLAALVHAPRELRDPRAWLARVVRHAAQRLSARRRRRSEHEARAAAERARAADERADDPAGLAEREQALRALLAAVGRLPEPVRAAVVLHHLDGMTLSEVALRTGAPLETVRSRVKRGLALLRADLARERGPAAWSLYLVRALELAPPAAGRGLALLSRAVAASIALMSSTLKLGAGAAALLVLAGLLLLKPAARSAPEVSPGAAPGAARALAAVPREDAAGAAEVRRPVPDAGAAAAALPSREEESPRTGGIVLDVFWADDRSPGTDIPVRLTALGPDAPEPAWATTSPEGRVELAGLRPGSLLARTLFGGLALLEVVAGETRAARLEIPAGIAVRGRVETAGGDPIPGAELFLSLGAADPQYEGASVALTDARGSFQLRAAPAGTGACLSARAAGYAPSEQVLLTGAPRTALELTLVLSEPGRALAGRVLAPDGQAVAGAHVLVGSEHEWQPRRRADGTPCWGPIGALARTDAQGGFALAGVPAGAVPLQVRAPGYPVWRGELLADAPQPLVVRLERGASVAGSVRTAGGTPVAGARVRVEPAFGFARLATTSAADGSYVLAPLPPGTVALVAERASDGLGVGGSGQAAARLALAPGAEQRWDPVLPSAPAVRGRVEAPGLALDGWTVRGWRDACAAGPRYTEETRTDTEGRFVLARAPEGEIALSLFARGGSSFPLARAEHVRGGGPEVVLRPDPALLPTCSIAGRLVDARGEAVRSADVYALHATLGSTLVHPDPEDGAFELPSLPPGEWTLHIDPLTPGSAVARVARALAPGESWDAGPVVLGPGGTLAVRLLRTAEAEASGPLEGATAQLQDEHGWTAAWLEFEGGAARSPRAVAPGLYRLVLGGSAAGQAPDQEVVIAAGEESVLAIELAGPGR